MNTRRNPPVLRPSGRRKFPPYAPLQKSWVQLEQLNLDAKKRRGHLGEGRDLEEQRKEASRIYKQFFLDVDTLLWGPHSPTNSVTPRDPQA